MARSRRRRYLSQDDEGLNLTPLLDVIFNLIFFFVVATTIRTEESAFDLTLPTASDAPSQTNTDPFPVVSINSAGLISLNGQQYEPDQFVEELRQLAEETAKDQVVLRVDGDARAQQQVDAMDLIRKAGITKIGLSVKVEE